MKRPAAEAVPVNGQRWIAWTGLLAVAVPLILAWFGAGRLATIKRGDESELILLALLPVTLLWSIPVLGCIVYAAYVVCFALAFRATPTPISAGRCAGVLLGICAGTVLAIPGVATFQSARTSHRQKADIEQLTGVMTPYFRCLVEGRFEEAWNYGTEARRRQFPLATYRSHWQHVLAGGGEPTYKPLWTIVDVRRTSDGEILVTTDFEFRAKQFRDRTAIVEYHLSPTSGEHLQILGAAGRQGKTDPW